MSEHKAGTHKEWLAARTGLLEREKELTRQGGEAGGQAGLARNCAAHR
jgi:predicted dithiol-disulfide oxidoreductase (DUF899 family)